MESPPGPEITIEGRQYLYFGGTSYLGLAAHPDVIEAACSAMRSYGLHSATSRAGIGTLPPVKETEQCAAQFFGCEDAFYFASGYSAAHIMVSTLAPDVDTVLIDEGAHPCLAEGAKLAGRRIRSFAHHSAIDLERRVRRAGRVLVLSDGTAPTMGDTAPVRQYVETLAARGMAASLLFDDAHGFGVLGDHGRGLLEAVGLWERTNVARAEGGVRVYVCGTLSKALGGFGGIIPGSREFLSQVRQSSRYFDGSSAPPAAAAAGSAKALQIALRQPELRMRLRNNTQRLRDGLRALGFQVPTSETAQTGVVTGTDQQMRELSEALRMRGIFVPYVHSYGASKGGMLRLAVFATHRNNQIDSLLSELRSLL
jgi:8-amino-7-oxononanoate synthase